MKFVYYDLGLYRGVELSWMVDIILPSLGIKNYHAYGLEACKAYADKLKNKYKNNDRVTIIHGAIASKNERKKLYYAPNALGHSIYSTKKNVTEQYEEVDGIVFSDWLRKNTPNFEKNFNVIKVNIEGAEWDLFNDLVSNKLNEHIKIFCGAGHDVEKVGELKNQIGEYYDLLSDNNIELHRFTEWKSHLNADIEKLIVCEIKKIVKSQI